MSYAQLHGSLTFNKKVIAVGNAATGAYLRMVAWVGANRTDGLVHRDIVRLVCSEEELRQLVAVELVDVVDGQHFIHNYLEHNISGASASDMEKRSVELSRIRAEAGRKGGLARASKGEAIAKQDAKQIASSKLCISLSNDQDSTGSVPEGVQGEDPPKLTAEQRYARAYAEGQVLAAPGTVYPDPTTETQKGELNRFTIQPGWGKGLRGEALLQTIRDVSRAYRREMGNDKWHVSQGFPPSLCLRWAQGSGWRPKAQASKTSGQIDPKKPEEKMDPKEYLRKMQGLVETLDRQDASEDPGTGQRSSGQ